MIIWVINGIAISVFIAKFVRFLSFRRDSGRPVKGITEFLEQQNVPVQKTIIKNIILDVASIVSAAVLGKIGLLNDSFITSLHILNPPSVAVLIGIGVGIGGLKEYFNARIT